MLAVNVPVLDAVKRYHTLRPRLPLPHAGNGSLPSIEAVAVADVAVNGAAAMLVAAAHVSLAGPAAGLVGVATGG